MWKYWPFYIWLAYLIWPYDLFPDILPGVGYIEDALFLGLAYWFFVKKRPDLLLKAKDAAYNCDLRELLPWHKSDQPVPYQLGRHNGKNPYQILNLSRTASLDEIKQAYRSQAARYHPDKVNHLGEELQQLAREKFHEIQWAYDRLVEAESNHKHA